jgi:hypothetical protein
MEIFWKAINIFQIHLTKDILGHLIHLQPYATTYIQKPCGNLQVSTWLCMDNSIKTHGEFLVSSKYLSNTSDLKYFSSPVPSPALYNQYHTKTTWKFASFHMVVWIIPYLHMDNFW